jgi:choline dehydrogenase
MTPNAVPSDAQPRPPSLPSPTFEFIVVGSGAGGGTVAARLVEAGHRVLLIEAGGSDPGPLASVPVFHPLSVEAPETRWDYFVHHYADPQRRAADSKYTPEEDGVLYPRAASLGGCTVHHAMITVAPRDRDWDSLASLTSDPTWSADYMRRYFERLEDCGYRTKPLIASSNRVVAWLARAWFAVFGPLQRLLHAAGLRFLPKEPNPSGHGFGGWLRTEYPDIRSVFKDRALFRVVLGAVEEVIEDRLGRLGPRLAKWLDPNDRSVLKDCPEGLYLVPQATREGRRSGIRERLLELARLHPERLEIWTNTLASRVLFDANNRAIGVVCHRGEHLYSADPAHGQTKGSARELPPEQNVFAEREVLLCGGAFGTPQLLQLSGIGPPDLLKRHNIPVRVPLSGVGRNLQDRYEVCVVSELSEQLALIGDAPLRTPAPGEAPDPHYAAWLSGAGFYRSNGVLLAILKKSRPELPEPDLFLFGLPGFFKGYFPEYSQQVVARKGCFSWAVLKAYTENNAGFVEIRSADPRDRPLIQFSYFEEGADRQGHDLAGILDGISLVREIMANTGDVEKRELIPGEHVQGKSELEDFVRREAWGHHASCTCPIGPDGDPMAVLNSDLQVRGTQGLRVVDASVFPKIPGYFIVSSIYMVAEKAADMLISDAQTHPPNRVFHVQS